MNQRTQIITEENGVRYCLESRHLMVKIYKYKRMDIQYYDEMRDENDYRTRKV